MADKLHEQDVSPLSRLTQSMVRFRKQYFPIQLRMTRVLVKRSAIPAGTFKFLSLQLV